MERFALVPIGLAVLLGFVVVGVAQAAPACALQWDPTFLAPPAPGLMESVVRAFTPYAGQLIVAGGFQGIAGVTVDSVAAWDPATSVWTPMPFTNCHGSPQPVTALAVYRGELYAAGPFDWSVPDPCQGDPCPLPLKDPGILAKWSPVDPEPPCSDTRQGDWVRVGGAVPAAAVRTLVVYDDGFGEKLYVGGHIPAMGSSSNPDSTHLLTWDGASWGFAADGVEGETGNNAAAPGVWDLLVVPPGLPVLPGLYAAGQFSAALVEGRTPTASTRGIARWYGGSWFTVGGGLDPDTLQCPVASALTSFGAAALSGTGGGAIEPKPVPCVPHIGALELFDDGFGVRVFVGGQFRDIGGFGVPQGLTEGLFGGSIAVNNLAAWDGFGWQAMGLPPDDGIVGWVDALEVMEEGSSLAVAGQFSSAAGSTLPASNIARWDGTGWSTLNGGLDPDPPVRCSFENGNAVEVLQAFGPAGGEYLYAGGSFDNASNPPIPAFEAFGLARWGCALTCIGDINFDGTVGVTDLLELLAAWGPCPPCPATCPADLNGDGVVDEVDEDILLAHYGSC